jgi:hypothetical protein
MDAKKGARRLYREHIINVTNWHSNTEHYLAQIQAEADICYQLHHRAAQYYQWWHKCVTIIIIILSTVIGCGLLGSKDQCEKNDNALVIVAAVLILLSGFFVMIKEAFDPKGASTQHKQCASGFLSLATDIQTELLLPRDRRRSAKEFVQRCVEQFQEGFSESAPIIPSYVARQYTRDQRRQNSNESSPGSSLGRDARNIVHHAPYVHHSTSAPNAMSMDLTLNSTQPPQQNQEVDIDMSEVSFDDEDQSV